MPHSAVPASHVDHVPAHVGSSNPADCIGRVVGTHHTPPAAQALAGQAAAPAALSVPAPPADLSFSPAKAQVAKRLRVSNEQSPHDGLSNPPDGIGKVVGSHLVPPTAQAFAAHVGAPAAPSFPALPADPLSPAKAKITKRLRTTLTIALLRTTESFSAVARVRSESHTAPNTECVTIFYKMSVQ